MEGIHSPGARRGNLREYPISPSPAVASRVLPHASIASCRSAASCGQCPAWRSTRDSRRTRSGAGRLGLDQSPWGKVRQTVDLYYGIAPGTINCEHQWWYPELAQADRASNCHASTASSTARPRTSTTVSSGARLSGEGVQGHAREQPPSATPCPAATAPRSSTTRRSAPEASVGHRRRGAFTPTSSTRKRKGWEK